jgi:peroxiredoxin Q/BCP
MEGNGFRDRIREFESADTVILGASFDPVEANCRFAEKFDFPFKLVCDTAHEVGTAYGAYDPGSPQYAKRISYLIGPDRRIKRVYAKVKPKDHPAEVLADLAALRST